MESPTPEVPDAAEAGRGSLWERRKMTERPERSQQALPGFWRAAEAFWSRNAHPRGQLWTHHVDERLGAFIGLWLLPTRVTPNVVTVIGLTVSLAIAGYVATLTAPVSLLTVAIVLLGWQLAFALDCTDGQLARERGVASPFGAWLDQLADFAAHWAVYVSLGLFIVRSLALSPISSALLVASLFGSNVFQQVASAERNVLVGYGGGIHSETRTWVKVLAGGRHLADYGAILFVSSLLLMAPVPLLGFLAATGALCTATVVGQVAYNWIRLAHPQQFPGSATPRQK